MRRPLDIVRDRLRDRINPTIADDIADVYDGLLGDDGQGGHPGPGTLKAEAALDRLAARLPRG